MSNYFINIPNTGSPSWKATVPSAANLPSDGNNNGDARVALDTDTIYIWNGTSWIAVATPSGSIAITALIGDVTATGPGAVPATVQFVGGSSAANVHSAELLANASTSSNTPNTIVKRDGSGNFSAGTITATLNGNASNVSGIVLPSHGGTGVANNNLSTITITGSFPLSLILTGASAVTLPASGTLATLAGAETFTNKTIDASLNTITNISNASISPTAAIDYSKLNLSNSIVNSDINTAAAIAYSKLNLLNSIVDADINSAAAISYSKLNLGNSIVNSDINTAAAIVYSKLFLANSIINSDINTGAAIAYSKLNLTNDIVNADINTAAAIAYSKLNLVNSIVNADINATAAIAYSKLNLSNSIVNADINTAANIAISKLASGTANQFIRENNGATSPIYVDLLGTANQVIVTNNAGNTTLSLPQNIATTSSPTFAALTVTGNISAANFSGSSSGTNTGDVTIGTANGLSLVGQVLSLALSSTSTTGALSSTDWNTFNNKQPTITIGALDAQPANATGLALVSNVLSTQSADTTHPGLVNNTTQSFSGNKTFTGTVTASNISGTNTGDVTLAAVGSSPNANAASLSGQVLNLQPADATNPGVVTAGTQTLAGNKTFTGNTISKQLTINGTAGAGFLQLNTQSVTPTTPVGGFILFGDATNRMTQLNTSGFTTTYDSNGITANRVYTLRDVSGKFLLDTRLSMAATTISAASTTILSTDAFAVYFVDTTAARTINLPTSTSVADRVYLFKDISGSSETNNITIVPSGTDTIEGLNVNKIFQTNYGSWTLVSNASNGWWLV